MKIRMTALAVGLPVIATLALTPAVAVATPSGSDSMTTTAAAATTTANIADSGPNQQRWISSPGSRVTLNPGNPAESGPTIPLKTEYFAWGGESYQEPQLKIFQAEDATPSGSGGTGTVENGHRENFDNLTSGGWTNENVTSQIVDLDGTNKGVRVSTAPGQQYGNLFSGELTVNLTQYPMLTVSVPQLGDGGISKWALKIKPVGQGDRMVQSDTTLSGTFDYDLSDIDETRSLTGNQTFQIRLFVSGSDGVNARTATFDYLQFWGTGDDGSTDPGDRSIGFEDPLDASTQSAWNTTNDQGHNFTYQGTAGGGVLTRGASATDSWGAAARTVTVDLDRYPSIEVEVGATGGNWNAAIYEGSVERKKLMASDSNAPGKATLDVASATGWSGTRTFQIRIYHNGSTGSSSTFTGLRVFGEAQWMATASAYSTTWRPEAIDFTADFGAGGTISGYDTTVGMNGFGRVLRPDFTSGYLGAVGRYSGDAAYDQASGTLSVVTSRGPGSYAWAVKFPAGTDLYFFSGESAARKGRNAATNPRPGGGYWAAALAADSDLGLGFGYELIADNTPAERARAIAAADATAEHSSLVLALEQARAGWEAHYNDFLAQVPVPQDFSLPGIDAKGVTAADVERAYYTAWIGLEANIMEPTPETQEPGDDFWQIATGKPSTYASGPKGAEASAEWDSLFGMQFMAHIRPAVAWSAFKGNMKYAVPPPGTSHETLPSRKAQTAWILYQVTGDTAELASIYDRLVEYLDWAAQESNMRWGYSDKGPNERDAEFYVSMIVDLGYAVQISEALGETADAARWPGIAESLTRSYENLFFPAGSNPLYKTWLSGEYPNVLSPRQYVLTGLHTPGLGSAYMDRLVTLFADTYDPAKGLAGLTGPENADIKAPDVQFITYGLLDQGMADEAEKVALIMNRDIIRSNVFAEVYGVRSDGSIWGGSVAPSIFGNIHLIDNLWLVNGYRMDLGDPAFVRLPSATGGISGLQVRAKKFDLNLSGVEATLSGAAVSAGLLPANVDLSQLGRTATPPLGEVSSDATLASLTYNETAVPDFAPGQLTYAVELPAATSVLPTVAATVTHPQATVAITQVTGLPGTARVTVTAADGTTATYEIAFTVKTVQPVPPAPSVLSVPASTSVTFGTAARITVRATSARGVPTGTIEVHRGSALLARESLVGGSARIQLPGTLSVGQHSLRVTYLSSTPQTIAGSQTLTAVRVTKRAAKLGRAAVVKPKKSAQRIRRGKAVTIQVRLTGVNKAAPTGRVTLRAGKRTLGKATVKKVGARGIATIKVRAKVTKRLKKGASVQVRYAGDKNYLKKNYSTKIRVR